MTRIVIATLLCVLLCAIVAVQSAPQTLGLPSDLPAVTPIPLVCGSNAHKVDKHAHVDCYENCQNRDKLRLCIQILYHGQFCVCNEGYIFLNGTTGDCVLAKDCPTN